MELPGNWLLLLDLPPAKLPEMSTVSDRIREDSSRRSARGTGRLSLLRRPIDPWYSGRTSPGWLRQKLEAVGLRSINNVVDVTNYVLLEVGQPLHAFDLAKINGGIVVRKAKPGEQLLALDEKEYQLNPDDLVIADHQRPLAIAGVMGGEQSGVSATTVDMLLEAAYFNPDFIRRTSRRLGLISESSFRFERGVDPEAVLLAASRATDLLLQVAGGKADESIVVGGTVPDLKRVVEMRPERCSKLLGMEVPDSASLLVRLGLKPAGGNRWEFPAIVRIWPENRT